MAQKRREIARTSVGFSPAGRALLTSLRELLGKNQDVIIEQGLKLLDRYAKARAENRSLFVGEADGTIIRELDLLI